MEPQTLKFPKNFYFGTSVASFQVEGNLGIRNCDWDVFLAKNPHIVKPDQIGPQWWNLSNAKSDIEKTVELGANGLRLSFEWARIEPEEGKINQAALREYHKLIDFLHEKNLKPVLTLNHYTLPEWIAKKGSWNSPDIIPAFEKYTELITSEFPEIKTWITINEPSVLIEVAYFLPIMPPQHFGLFSALNARKHMLEVHRRAYAVIKKNVPNSQVSVAYSFRWYRPENQHDLLEVKYADLANYLDSMNYIESLKDTLDFIGVNFYAGYYLNLNLLKLKLNFHLPRSEPPKTVLFGEVRKPGAYVSDLGAPIVPGFFLDLLRTLHNRFHKPIIITENGIADHHDKHRAFYLLTHLVALWKAIQEGIDINEYYVWSCIDNLEWVEGYRQEFGLTHVDPITGQRQTRNSAYLYQNVMKTNTIHIEKLIDEYLEGHQKTVAQTLVHKLLNEKENATSDYL